jgi:hypothetical protein
MRTAGQFPFRIDTGTVSPATWNAAIEFYNKIKGKHGVNNSLLQRFGVNKDAIQRRLLAGNHGYRRCGAKALFTAREELVIKRCIFVLQDACYSITRRQLLNVPADVARKMEKKPPGEMWMRLFMKRHPDISMYKSKGLAAARYNALSADVLKSLFDNLQVASRGFDPRRIFIIDEIAVSTPSYYQVCCRIIGPSHGHHDTEALKYLQVYGVTVLALLPNTTSALCLLDVAFIGLLKSYFTDKLSDYMEYQGTLNMFTILEAFKKAFSKASKLAVYGALPGYLKRAQWLQGMWHLSV